MRRRDFLLSGALPFAPLGSRRNGMTCVLLKLTGGPSHIDTWDPKPDAPSGIRGPFKAIATNVSGIQIAEIFPRMARCADKYVLIRSLHHDLARYHDEASDLMFNWVRSDVNVITLNHAWDCHGWEPYSSIASYRDAAAKFDIVFTSLLEQLHRQDLFDTTLVIALGEFGRSPRINPSGGRDHWPHCFTLMMAGGGLRGGQVYGSSDGFGEAPRDNPVTPAMLTATIHALLGNPHDPCANPVLSALLL